MAIESGTNWQDELSRQRRILISTLDTEEKLILLAISDHMPQGNTFYASIARLVVWTSLGKKTIQRRIRGYSTDVQEPDNSEIKRIMQQRNVKRSRAHQILKEQETKRYRAAWHRGERNVPYIPGLIDKKILKLERDGSAEKNEPAMYTFNDAALMAIENPKAISLLELDKARASVLPGFRQPLAPGHPIYPERQLPVQSLSPAVLPSVRETLGVTNQSQLGLSPSVGETHPGVRETLAWRQGDASPGVRETLAWRQGDASPSVRLTPELRRKDVVVKTSSTDATEDEQKLATGLRHILPTFDKHGVKTILKRCRTAAPDCTVEEILHFANQKAESVLKGHNPPGLLIQTVCRCFEEGDIEALRKYLQNEREVAEAAERVRVETAEQDYQALLNQQAEISRQMEVIDTLPDDQFAPLHQRAQDLFFNERPNIWEQSPKEQVEKNIRQYMRKLMFERKDS